MNVDQGMIMQRPGDGCGKSVAIDRERAAGGDLVGVGRAHDQRTQPAHFGVQQSDRIIGGVVGTKRVGAYEFGKAIGAMGFGHSAGTHLVQGDRNARLGELPGRFRAGEARADDMHGFRGGFDSGHDHRGSAFSGAVECGCLVDTTTPAAKAGVIRSSVG